MKPTYDLYANTALLMQRMPMATAATMALNFVCAVVITLVNGGVGLLQNMVIATCIGTLIFLLVYPPRVLIWGANKVRPALFFLIVLLSIPIGQYLGSKLAGVLLGRDLADLNSFASGRAVAWMGFTLLCAVGSTSFFASRERMMRAEAAAANERARAEAIERQAITAQLQLLQAQIEPHMLFNTLANVQGLIAIDPARSQQMLDQLIQYLRATLSSSRAESTTLGQEFALMEAYLGLMAVRMGARLSYRLELPPALRQHAIAPMLLQPLVENAIIHGLEPKLEGGHVHVRASQENGVLTICVADDGLGLDAPSTPGTRLGVANTRARLGAMFGASAGLTLEPNTPQGAIARLTLPIATP